MHALARDHRATCARCARTRCCSSTPTRWRSTAGTRPGEGDPHRRPLPLGPAHGRLPGRRHRRRATARGRSAPPASTTSRGCSTTASTAATRSDELRDAVGAYARGERDATDEVDEWYGGGREQVRTAIMDLTGHFPTESSHHASEYLPLLPPHAGGDAVVHRRSAGTTSSSAARPRRGRAAGAGRRARRRAARGRARSTPRRSSTRCSPARRASIYGNVPNTGLITNLPDGCCVEVPCLVDRNGVQPTYVGDLPAACAGVNLGSIAVQACTVEAYRDAQPRRRPRRARARPADQRGAVARPTSTGWPTSCSRPQAAVAARVRGYLSPDVAIAAHEPALGDEEQQQDRRHAHHVRRHQERRVRLVHALERRQPELERHVLLRVDRDQRPQEVVPRPHERDHRRASRAPAPTAAARSAPARRAARRRRCGPPPRARSAASGRTGAS